MMIDDDYQATQRSNLSQHTKNVHQKSENITCTECFKSFQKKHLTRHLKLFHSGEQPKYDCKLCTFQTIHPSSLKTHVQKVHQIKI